MSATAVSQAEERPLTIGAVCRLLREEFPDISISKIRYLEDQGLLAPRRTPGRYRLFGEDDVDRLRTILRLQRDEFLPLRVIRQELATTAAKGRRRRGGLSGSDDEEVELSSTGASGSTARARWTSQPPAPSSRASASTRGTSARSAPRPSERSGCSLRSLRRHISFLDGTEIFQVIDRGPMA